MGSCCESLLPRFQGVEGRREEIERKEAMMEEIDPCPIFSCVLLWKGGRREVFRVRLLCENVERMIPR